MCHCHTSSVYTLDVVNLDLGGPWDVVSLDLGRGRGVHVASTQSTSPVH